MNTAFLFGFDLCECFTLVGDFDMKGGELRKFLDVFKNVFGRMKGCSIFNVDVIVHAIFERSCEF